MTLDLDVHKRFSDMIRFSQLVMARSEAMGFEEFTVDPVLYEGFVRLVQNIGEAAAYLRRFHPAALESVGIDWTDIIAMRNRIVHDYTGVIPAIVFAVIKENLPELVTTLTTHIEKHS